MKKLFCLAIIAILVVKVSAQSKDRFNAAMQNGVRMLDSARNTESFTAAANYFERIANAEAGEWLPQYYTSYALLMSANTGKQDNDTKDVIFDKAMSFAENADKIRPGNSEILALQSYIVFMKVSLAPQARAMTLIPKSGALVEKAIAVDPENPRALLVKGQNLFYTPEAFGGGKAKAKEVLTRAAEKFEAAKNVDLMPSWGKGRCADLLAQVSK
jgi:hypothetical protein